MWFIRLPTPTLPARLALFHLFTLILGAALVFAIFERQIRDHSLERLDHELETQVLVFEAKMDGLDARERTDQLQTALNLFAQANGSSHSFFRILSANGTPLAASDLEHWTGIQTHPVPLKKIAENPFVWESALLARESVRLIYYQSPGGHILQVGASLGDVMELNSHLQMVFGTSMVVLVLVVSLFGWGLIRRSLRGIGLVRDAAARIRGQGDLHFQVPLPTGSLETDELAVTFNEMLEKIRELLRNMRHLTDNVAHDIRTPVARMRGLAEGELRRYGVGARSAGEEGHEGALVVSEEQMVELAGMVVDECDQILQLVNTLLEIAALESGILSDRLESLRMDHLLKDGYELFEAVVESKNQRLELNLAEGSDREIWANRKNMQRLVANLLDNAFKYTQAGGAIRVSLSGDGQSLKLEVEDSGIGIPDEEKALIFKRFYRADRSRSLPGNGLGLSFCAAVVKAIGGSIEVRDSPMGGALFCLVLPSGTGELSHAEPMG